MEIDDPRWATGIRVRILPYMEKRMYWQYSGPGTEGYVILQKDVWPRFYHWTLPSKFLPGVWGVPVWTGPIRSMTEFKKLLQQYREAPATDDDDGPFAAFCRRYKGIHYAVDFNLIEFLDRGYSRPSLLGKTRRGRRHRNRLSSYYTSNRLTEVG